MTTLQLALICLTVLGVVAALRAPLPLRSRRQAGKPTTIHTIGGELTLTGVILDEWPDRTRLADARLVTADGETPVPGGVATVLKRNEAWRQEHLAVEAGPGKP